MKVSATVLVPGRAEALWDRLAAWERQPEWMVDAVSVRVVSPERAGPGTRIAVRTRVLGLPALTDVLEVTEWEPPRRLVMARSGFVRGSGTWLLEDDGAGTRFTWS